MIQYQIVVVNLDPTVGSEIKKTRPCVILSPDEMNTHLKTVVVAPLTSTNRNYPTRCKVEIGGRISRVALDQIRTIDKRRIVEVQQRLRSKEVVEIKAILRRTYIE